MNPRKALHQQELELSSLPGGGPEFQGVQNDGNCSDHVVGLGTAGGLDDHPQIYIGRLSRDEDDQIVLDDGSTM